jgi:organic radical activating enzyme
MRAEKITGETILVLRPFWWFESPEILKSGDDDIPIAVKAHFRPIVESFTKPRRARDVLVEASVEPTSGLAVLQYLVDSKVLVDWDSVWYPPPAIELEISSACNADCIMCPREVLRTGRGEKYMSRAVFEKILRNVGGRGVSEYCLCGMGEPLLHPDWFEYTEQLRRGDIESRIVIYTNGLVLDEKNVDKLISAPVDSLQISLHSTDPRRHRAVVRRGDIRVILANIDRLLQRLAEVPNRRLTLDLLKTALDNDRNDDLAAWAKSRGVNYSSWPIWNRAGNVRSIGTINNISPRWCRHYADKIYIDVEGRVLPCCCDIANEAEELNATAVTYENIYGFKLRRLMATEPLSAICHRCDAPETNKPYLDTTFFKIANEKHLRGEH